MFISSYVLNISKWTISVRLFETLQNFEDALCQFCSEHQFPSSVHSASHLSFRCTLLQLQRLLTTMSFER